MLRDNKGQLTNNPVITGIMVLAMLGIILGIVVMVYAEMDPIILDASSTEVTAEAVNWTAVNTWNVTTFTMAQLPHVSVYNATYTGIENTDFNVSVANSSIQLVNGGTLDNATEYSVDYSYQGEAYISAGKVSSNVYKGFNMASISPLVMAAGLVISIVLGMLGSMYLGGRRD